MSEDKKIIFVACGQRNDKEKELGKKIAELIDSRGDFKPFLAEDTHSFNALTSEIFENLNNCAGFIAILHKRENIDTGNTFRSSVWINQEIAILSFLRFRDKRDIPFRIFIESKEDANVRLEGVLEYIMANPIGFASDAEVIEQVKEWLNKTAFSTKKKSEDYLLASKRVIKLLPGYTGELHTYRLDFEIANIGNKTVKDISLEFYFPKGIPTSAISSKKFDLVDPKEKELNDYYGYGLKNHLDKILPGKSESIYCFDFQINHNVYFKGLTHKNIIWKIFAEDMEPITETTRLEGLEGEGVNF